MFGRILNTPMYLCKWYLAWTAILGSVSGIFRYIQALFKSILTHIHNHVYHWHIQNPGIFLSQRMFRTPMYFPNTILNIFTKPPSWLFDTVLNGPLFYRCYLASIVTLQWSYFRHTQAYSRLIQPYLVFSRHIKNPGISRNILLKPYASIF